MLVQIRLSEILFVFSVNDVRHNLTKHKANYSFRKPIPYQKISNLFNDEHDANREVDWTAGLIFCYLVKKQKPSQKGRGEGVWRGGTWGARGGEGG